MYIGSHTIRERSMSWLWALALLAALAGRCSAQDQPVDPAPAERWNLFYQATSIGDYHGTFHSPYEGAFSLQDRSERDVSLTTTLFLGFQLGNTQFYIDP